MLYTGHNNHRVQVLDHDLNFFKEFVKYGSNCGQFNRPWGVAFDNGGLVYITNHRVQVFKDDGTFLRPFGGEGSNEGQLSWLSSTCSCQQQEPIGLCD